MLLPKTTPSDILGTPSIAEVIPTNSSGSEVPTAKIMADIAKTPTLLLYAILLKETIIHSADLIKINEKEIKIKTCQINII